MSVSVCVWVLRGARFCVNGVKVCPCPYYVVFMLLLLLLLLPDEAAPFWIPPWIKFILVVFSRPVFGLGLSYFVVMMLTGM